MFFYCREAIGNHHHFYGHDWHVSLERSWKQLSVSTPCVSRSQLMKISYLVVMNWFGKWMVSSRFVNIDLLRPLVCTM